VLPNNNSLFFWTVCTLSVNWPKLWICQIYTNNFLIFPSKPMAFINTSCDSALVRLRLIIQTSLLSSYMRKSAWNTGRVNIGKPIWTQGAPDLVSLAPLHWALTLATPLCASPFSLPGCNNQLCVCWGYIWPVAVDITKMISDRGGVSHSWFAALYLVQLPSFSATPLWGHSSIHRLRRHMAASVYQLVAHEINSENGILAFSTNSSAALQAVSKACMASLLHNCWTDSCTAYNLMTL